MSPMPLWAGACWGRASASASRAAETGKQAVLGSVFMVCITGLLEVEGLVDIGDIQVLSEFQAERTAPQLGFEVAVAGVAQVAAVFDPDHGDDAFDVPHAEQFARDAQEDLAAVSGAL